MATTGFTLLTTDMGADELKPQIRKFITEQGKGMPSKWEQYMTRIDGNELYVEDIAVGGVGAFPLIGEADDIQLTGITFGAKTRYQTDFFQLGFAISGVDKQYNRIGKVNKVLAKFVKARKATVEIQAALPLNQGFSSSYVGADNVALFSSSHTPLTANIQTGATTVSNLGTASDVTPSAIEAGVTAFMTMTGQDGIYTDISPRWLICHPTMYLPARRALESAGYYTTSGTNSSVPSASYADTKNVLLDQNITPIANPWLTDTDAWFLVADKSETEWLVYWSLPYTDKSWDEPTVGPLGATVYSQSFGMTVGWSDWIGLYGNAGN